MNRSTAFSLLALFCFVAVGMGAVWMHGDRERMRIATVDMSLLLEVCPRMIAAGKLGDEEQQRIREENEARLARLREIDAELGALRDQMSDPTLGEAERREFGNEFMKKTQEGVEWDRDRRDYMQRRSAALEEERRWRMEGVRKEIRGLVQEQAKRVGYHYVLDSSAMGGREMPFVLHRCEATDITALLLERLAD